MEYAVIYYYGIDNDVIRDIEIVKARNLESAYEKTETNLELTIAIPLIKSNIDRLKALVNCCKKFNKTSQKKN